MSRHPITPMDESDLRLHLGRQTLRPIGLVDVLHLEAGAESCAAQIDALLRAGSEIVLFDTLTPGHLGTIGRLLWERAQSAPPLFVVGSSGVEYALTAFWQDQGLLPAPPRLTAQPVDRILVASGSCSPVTARQIEWALANGFMEVAIDPVRLLQAEGAGVLRPVWEAILESAMGGLLEGRSVILHICRGPDDPRLAATTEWLARRGEPGGARRLGTLLGRLLRDLLELSDVRRAVVAGGDTSSYAARELGIMALETVAPIAPGSPLCRVHAPDRSPGGLEILFKGGQVGRIDLFESVLQGAAP
jgi:uncharacterized protein YgbK (DUF1537 family)